MKGKAKKRQTDFEEVKIDPDTPIYTTGVVCSILNIPIWTLKQLDIEGIVCPPRKTEMAARLYSKRELKMVEHCWFYIREHNVKVSGLKIILKIQEGTFEGP